MSFLRHQEAGFNDAGNIENAQQQAALNNPIHAFVSPQPIKTPREVQAGFAALIGRYAFRAYTKSITDSASPERLRRWSGADYIRDRFFAENHISNINARLAKFEPYAKKMFPGGAAHIDVADIARELRKTPEAKTLVDDIKHILTRWDGGDLHNNTIQYFFKEPHKGGISLESRTRIKSKMGDALFENYYDTILGLGSLLYTRSMQNSVQKDLDNIYSECVGYEKNKPAENVTGLDIANSSNQIIQSTMGNFQRKKMIRYGISALPFLKWVPSVRAIQWGEAAIGGWGILWAADVWGREPTMLENFRSFVNNKLNPLYGIGDPIKSSEIIDLYQQYAFLFNKDIAFQSISMNDGDANRMWAESERMFIRIADLMNESYNFKHTTIIDPETNSHESRANFMLPKFIYLLGHGMLNARRPDWSMAYIELANKFDDMEAVKDAAHMQRSGADISQVVEKYDIDLHPVQRVNSAANSIRVPRAQSMESDSTDHTLSEAKTKVVQAEEAMNASDTPDTSVKTDQLVAANLSNKPSSIERATA